MSKTQQTLVHIELRMEKFSSGFYAYRSSSRYRVAIPSTFDSRTV